jgi:hypothetical protein
MCQEFCTKVSGTYDLTKVDDKCHLVHLHNGFAFAQCETWRVVR